jgi:hypothetical protein
MALTMIYFHHISKNYQYKSNKELALLEAEEEEGVSGGSNSVKGTGSDDNIGTNLLTASAEIVEGRIEATRRSQSHGSSGHRMTAVPTEEADVEDVEDDEEELGVSSHAKFMEAFDEGYR